MVEPVTVKSKDNRPQRPAIQQRASRNQKSNKVQSAGETKQRFKKHRIYKTSGKGWKAGYKDRQRLDTGAEQVTV